MADPGASRPHPRRTLAQARRVRILEAARERFIERGLGGATTRDIARAADVPESSMFRHFASKDELFEEAIAAHVAEILRSARKDDASVIAGANSESARMIVLQGVHQHYLEVIEHVLPALGAAMFSERDIGRDIYRARVQPLLEEMARESAGAMVGWANERADAQTMIFLAFGGYLLLSVDAYFGGTPIDHGRAAQRLAWLIQYGVRGRPAEPLRLGDAAEATSGRSEAESAPVQPGGSEPPVSPAVAPRAQGPRIRRERSDSIANRARLLDAAREEFFARGFGGATTREIARSAGTTESALYRHFSSKEQLFHEAVGSRLQEIITAGLRAAETELSRFQTDDERLAVLGRQHLHYLRVIEQTAPLLGTALFSEREAGRQLYRSIVRPFLDRMTETTHEALDSWSNAGADARTLIFVAVGGYLLISLDAYFRQSTIDHDLVADRITWLLYYGVAGG